MYRSWNSGRSTLTKQHFERAAYHLFKIDDTDERLMVVKHFSAFFSNENSFFDKARFFDGCGFQQRTLLGGKCIIEVKNNDNIHRRSL